MLQDKEEVMLDIDYAIELHKKCAAVYSKFKFGFNLVFVLGGAYVASCSEWQRQAVGTVMMICATLTLLIDPSEKKAMHEEHRRSWLALRADSIDLDLKDIERRRIDIRRTDIDAIEALKLPAFNENLLRHGHKDDCADISIWSRLVNLLA